MAAILDLHPSSSGISVTSIASFAAEANTNTQATYNQFRKDLCQAGVPEDTIQQKEGEILDALKPQGIVTSNQIGGGDQGHYEEHFVLIRPAANLQ